MPETTDLTARARLAAAGSCRERAEFLEELAEEIERLRADRDALDFLEASGAGVFPPWEYPGRGWAVEPEGDRRDHFAPTLRGAIHAAREVAGPGKENTDG